MQVPEAESPADVDDEVEITEPKRKRTTNEGPIIDVAEEDKQDVDVSKNGLTASRASPVCQGH